MAISSVQSNAGGFGEGGGGGSGNSTSSVGYANATEAGSLLLCSVFWTGVQTFTNPPVTAGVTWVLIQSSNYTGTAAGGCAIYASYDTPSIPNTSLTQILIGTNTSTYVEFDLYEFAGVIATGALDASANLSGPTSGSVTQSPAAVNQTGPYSNGHAGWQGYLPFLIRGGSAGNNSTSVVDYFTGDGSIVYVNAFSLGIPGTATVAGVAVTFQGATYVSSGAPVSNNKGVQVALMNGASPIGTAKQQFFTNGQGSPQNFTLGSSTDTWGASLSPSGCNAASFGIGFAQLGAHSTDAGPAIANCTIQVWYSDPSEATQTAKLSTTTSDLIFVVGQGAASSGSYAPVGPGFTLGIQTTVCNFGESQYQLNVPAAGGFSGVPTAFGSVMGGQNWACVSAAFKGTPASGTATPAGLRLTTALGPTVPGVPIDYGTNPGSNPLPPGVNTTYFYARWVGWLTPSVTGTYTVGLNYSDGADFFIGSQPIVTDLSGAQTPTNPDPSTGIPAFVQNSKIFLVKNVAYPVVIEWQHGPDPDLYVLQFLWTPPVATNGPPSVAQVIPEANLSLVGSWWNGDSSSWYPTAWY